METDNDTGVLIFVAIVALLTVLGGIWLAFSYDADASPAQIEAVAE